MLGRDDLAGTRDGCAPRATQNGGGVVCGDCADVADDFGGSFFFGGSHWIAVQHGGVVAVHAELLASAIHVATVDLVHRGAFFAPGCIHLAMNAVEIGAAGWELAI